MWFPYIQLTGGFSFSSGRIPEIVQHLCHLSNLSLTISFITVIFLLVPSPHSYIGPWTDFWTHCLCSSYSLEMSLLRSPSSTLYIFLPRFGFLTSPSWAEMPLPWILSVLYHNTLFIITLQIPFPANRTVSYMKTPAISALALSCSERLEPTWYIMDTHYIFTVANTLICLRRQHGPGTEFSLTVRRCKFWDVVFHSLYDLCVRCYINFPPGGGSLPVGIESGP